MAVEIGALRALLSLDSAAFEKGAKRAQSSMDGLQRSLAKTGQRLQSIGKTITAGLTLPLVAATGLLVRSSLSAIDAQAKFAQSLGTTVASLQVLARASETAGISQEELDGSLRRMTQRLSQAEAGAGPAVKALKRLGLATSDFANIDAAERVKLIQQRLADLIPEAQRAGVASEIFGDKTGLALLRLDASQIDAARAELERFGVTVSELGADQIEEANDAMSSLSLVAKGLGNTLAVALAPTLTAISRALGDVAAWFNRLSPLMKQTIGIAVAVAAAIGPITFALGLMSSGMAVAIGAANGLIVALFSLRGALIATGFGAIIVAAGVLANEIFKLVEAAGSFGAALDALGRVAAGVWDGIATSAEALPLALGATWQEIRSSFLGLLASLQALWSKFLLDLAEKARSFGLDEKSNTLFNAGSRASMGVSAFKNEALLAAAVAEQLRQSASDLATLGFDKAAQALVRLNAVTAKAVARPTIKLPTIIGGEVDDTVGGKIKPGKPDKSIKIDELEKLNDRLKETDSLTQGVERSFESAFTGFVTGTDSAKGALRGLLNSLAQVAASEVFRGVAGGGLFSSILGIGGGLFSSILGIGDSLLGGLFGGAGGARGSGPLGFFGFAGGGFTGNGPRSGGVDGRGGFPAILHPNETVIDHESGGIGSNREVQVTIFVEPSGEFDTRVERTSRGVATRVVDQRTPGIVSGAFDRAREERSFG